MKKLYFLSFLTISIVSGLFVFSNSAKAQCTATLYDSLTGGSADPHLIIGAGSSSFLGVADASSVKIGSFSSCALKLWRNTNQGGDYTTVGWSSGGSTTLMIHNAADYANVLCALPVTVYDSPGLSFKSSASTNLSSGDCINLSSIGWGNRISAASVPTGCTLTLYNDDHGYTGCNDVGSPMPCHVQTKATG